ncbi:MAG: hypothetical protein ACRCU2_01855, partial [Planktothrix sp.]
MESDRTPLPFAFPHQLGSQIFDFGLETRFIPSALHPVQMVAIEKHQTQVIIGAKQATIKGIPTDVVEKLFRPAGFSLLDLNDQGPRTKDQGPRTKDQGPRTKDQGPRT